ncbi:unnamed protein product, partial [Mesorhabditis belari]|uniref:Thioredoxin-related transmembrane protein 1 n=1 Tax=Mesorhabditis belari TaxID=2138241 RepID=A0AAF3F2E2_9BILA
MRIVLLLLSLCTIGLASKNSKYLVKINETNWDQIMRGEWMVEFHAPWCPACKDLQKSWNAFADWSQELDVQVGEVDVTVNPGLSGRFLVTALPTIYHVKDGVFRQYSGPRDKNDFISYVEDKRWRNVEPVPSYKHPNSAQMGVVAVFFKLSMAVRDLHNHLVENKGVPSWASYSMFALVTLALGCILGFLIVMAIDYFFPTGARAAKKQQQNQKQQHAAPKKKENEGEKKKEDEKKENVQAKGKKDNKKTQ